MCFIRKDNMIEISEDRVIHMLISICASLAAVLDRIFFLIKAQRYRLAPLVCFFNFC
jgi:hypothetical protein